MRGLIGLAFGAVLLAVPLAAAIPDLPTMLSYPFIDGLTAARDSDRIAWTGNTKGIRTVWTASGPGFAPRAVRVATADDGQELTGLTLAPDGKRLVWVRGGDHDANWEEAGRQPNAAGATDQPKLTLWTALAAGGPAVAIGEGDAPALANNSRLAFVKNGELWVGTAAKDGTHRVYDEGKVRDLVWSPDGSRLAFVSGRGDHSFVGVYAVAMKTVTWIAPSTGIDGDPVWSPDGTRVAFTRQWNNGGAPEPLRIDVPRPWAIVVADVASGGGRVVWSSPKTLVGSYPGVPGGASLGWAAGSTLVFRAEFDGWPHLYALPATGGEPRLLTPGKFMVEDVRLGHDGTSVFYTANANANANANASDVADDDRRHVFSVPVDRGPAFGIETPSETRYGGLQFRPTPLTGGFVAFVSVTATRPAAVAVSSAVGSGFTKLIDHGADAYPAAALVVPQRVTFAAADGTLVHGQLFTTGGAAKKPAVIFVHGGPPRQMLLGWSYMEYYSNAYAVNQALAARGFVVLSVNYRLGIGYGRAFQHPDKGGPAGASEYQDVVAGAKYLESLPGVDPARLGIWGGSYGGYLTGLALARNSDIFKAGVDLHGVHDWSRLLAEEIAPAKRYEQGEWTDALHTAFTSSPAADVATWRSPVLLIQGDDDRNVRFNQTIDLARRLDAAGVAYEELVLPNEIHGFLRHASWLKADAATIDFLTRKLMP